VAQDQDARRACTQGKRLPSAEQMEALRAKFAKNEPRKEQRANNGRAKMRA
jgi:hypothetical protein